MRSNRLAGHVLIGEGRMPFRVREPSDSGFLGMVTPQIPEAPGFTYADGGSGLGVCSCGASSEVVPTIAARRRWHSAHKDEERRLIAVNLAADRADPRDYLGRTPRDDWLKD